MSRFTLLAVLFAALPAAAQTWPARPIHIVVPCAAGGTIDVDMVTKTSTPQELDELIRDELSQWEPVVRKAKIEM